MSTLRKIAQKRNPKSSANLELLKTPKPIDTSTTSILWWGSKILGCLHVYMGSKWIQPQSSYHHPGFHVPDATVVWGTSGCWTTGHATWRFLDLCFLAWGHTTFYSGGNSFVVVADASEEEEWEEGEQGSDEEGSGRSSETRSEAGDNMESDWWGEVDLESFDVAAFSPFHFSSSLLYLLCYFEFLF